MRLAEQLESTKSVRAKIDNPKKLYGLLMTEVKNQRGAAYFEMLWSLVAPTGNIYRYNGLLAERRKHCEDIRKQAFEIADSHEHLLGGAGKSSKDRLSVLIDLLKNVQIHGSWAKRNELAEAPIAGFHPLQEFIEDEVERWGPLWPMPADPQDRAHHIRTVLIAAFIFSIQVLAPFLVCANRWDMKTNYLKDPLTLWSRMTFAEALCFGNTHTEKMTTVMGVCFNVVIIFCVRLYVAEENDNSVKSSRLPTDTLWYAVGIFANMWCCLLTVLAVPLLFWSEDTPTNIVLDSMTLLFIFKLDDLSEVLRGFLRMSDEEFQRVSSWNAALLAQCPVRVRDLINEQAKTAQEIWRIQFDTNTGNLLTAPDKDGLKHVCETRLMPVGQTQRLSEGTPLMPSTPRPTTDPIMGGPVHENSLASLASTNLYYYTSPDDRTVLPSVLTNTMYTGWFMLGWFLFILQFLIPIAWFVVNKPCY